jgi:Na+-transporting NADH:ubiquinone oxidoreductase subunit C
MPDETIGKTLGVAVAVCVVCSVLVSTAAVCLKPIQDRNKTLEKKTNVVMAAGLLEAGQSGDVDKLFDELEVRVVDLSTDAFAADVDPESLDQVKDAKDPELGMKVENDVAKIKKIGKYQPVYFNREGDEVKRVVLPVYGKGLWSTMRGFLALDGDLRTIKSLSFHTHEETPGLGGEIDNPRWKQSWIDKQGFDENGDPQIKVVKGRADKDADDEVDGLSGATLTARGVENLVRFWLGEEGFGPILETLRAGGDDG